MSNGVTTDRLVTLRNRWEADPTSRIFLQLAEEHRHLGQIQEALGVLDRGLQEHPGYLSALVAKGRCHLELGEPEPARAVLERVLKQDATQMVANKLLVRAYLDLGEPGRARERLDLYRLLNDSDPEIEVLRRRIQAMDQPPKPSSAEPAREAALFELPPLFPDLLTPSKAPRRTAPQDSSDVFGFEGLAGVGQPPPEPAATAAPAVLPPELPVPAQSEAPRPLREPSIPAPNGDVFPGLHSGRAHDRYLSGLSSEGIFPIAAARPAPLPPVPPPPPIFSVLSATVEAPAPAITERIIFSPPEPEPIELPVEAFRPAEPVISWQEPPIPLPEPEAEPAWVPEPELAPLPPLAPLAPMTPLAPITPLATVTLAEIYVSQGHPAEAERIYREVLRREPDNAAAQAGFDRLSRMERRLRPLEARDLLVEDEESAVAVGEGSSSRVRHLLQSYLKRIRERSPRDVS